MECLAWPGVFITTIAWWIFLGFMYFALLRIMFNVFRILRILFSCISHYCPFCFHVFRIIAHFAFMYFAFCAFCFYVFRILHIIPFLRFHVFRIIRIIRIRDSRTGDGRFILATHNSPFLFSSSGLLLIFVLFLKARSRNPCPPVPPAPYHLSTIQGFEFAIY
jgi:hypothetical protein